MTNCPDCITPLEAASMGLPPCEHCRIRVCVAKIDKGSVKCEFMELYKSVVSEADKEVSE